ncbi:MAG: hypothetical protein ACD_11C00152G0001, partial [uncultured bacterium]
MKAGKILEITREFSKFSLGNKKTKVELRYPDGEVAYDVKYSEEKDIKEGMIYEKKKDGGWEWRKNVEDVENVEYVQAEESGEDVEIVQDEEGEQLGQFEQLEQFEQVSGGFGFGEEEDALEVVEMLVNELDRDIDEIYAEGEVQNVENVQIVQDVEAVESVKDVKAVQNVKVVFPGIPEAVLKLEIPSELKVRTEGNEYKF